MPDRVEQKERRWTLGGDAAIESGPPIWSGDSVVVAPVEELEAARADADYWREIAEARLGVAQAENRWRTSLERRARTLTDALRPFAALADVVDELRHEDDSTCPHRLRASDLRIARSALAGSSLEGGESRNVETAVRVCQSAGLTVSAGSRPLPSGVADDSVRRGEGPEAPAASPSPQRPEAGERCAHLFRSCRDETPCCRCGAITYGEWIGRVPSSHPDAPKPASARVQAGDAEDESRPAPLKIRDVQVIVDAFTKEFGEGDDLTAATYRKAAIAVLRALAPISKKR